MCGKWERGKGVCVVDLEGRDVQMNSTTDDERTGPSSLGTTPQVLGGDCAPEMKQLLVVPVSSTNDDFPPGEGFTDEEMVRPPQSALHATPSSF